MNEDFLDVFLKEALEKPLLDQNKELYEMITNETDDKINSIFKILIAHSVAILDMDKRIKELEDAKKS